MAPRVRTITLCLDIETAPFARVEVIIIGSISGVRPTAMLKENKRALAQSPLAIPLITNTIGTINSIIRTNRPLTESTPLSKLVLALSPERDWAIEPKKVLLPVINTIADALPLTILEPINPMFLRSVNPSILLFSPWLNFSTGADSPVSAA